MKKSILKDCLRIARSKLKRHPEYNNFPHFTFFIQDNSIVSIGLNRCIVPEKKWGYNTKDFLSKYHAELDAWRRCKIKPYNMFAVNIRLNKKQEIRLSAPCLSCGRLLSHVGIKKCWFTHPDGWSLVKYGNNI